MSSKKLVFFFWTLFCVLPLIAGGLTGSGKILHSVQSKAYEHKDFKVEAVILNNSGEIDFVELRYRFDGEEGFRAIDMRPVSNSGRYQATLPGRELSGSQLEYVVVAHLMDGSSITYPEYNNPQLTAFDLPATTPIVPQESPESPFIIVSPEIDEEIAEEEVVVSVSLFNVQEIIDLKSIKLKVDGFDVTANSQISSDLVVFAPPRAKRGLHRVEISAKDNTGAEIPPLSWTFRTLGAAESEKKFTFRGNGYGEFRSESFGNRTLDEAGSPTTSVISNTYSRVGLTLNMQYENWVKMDGDLLITSEEKNLEQPRNRYLFTVATRPLIIKAGDVIANFNDLMLWGKRVRGFYGQLNFGVIHFDFITGETNRAVDPRFNDTAIDDSISQGGITNADSINQIRLNYRLANGNGTYKQSIIGFRPSFGGDNFRWGLNFLKAKDEVGSILYGNNSQLAGSQPKDNIVLGTDLKLRLDGGRVDFTSGIALGLVTNDISQPFPDSLFGAPTKAIKDYDKYFIVNLSTTPFPDTTTISAITSALSKATSYNAILRLNYFNNLFQFKFLKNGSVYTSLGQSFLTKDKKGFEVSDRIRLLGSRLFLNVFYENYSDNTDEAKEFTTSNNGLGFGVSYFPGPDLPSATVNYRSADQKNDATADSTSNPLLDNGTNNITFSTNYNFKALGFNQSASLNFVTSTRKDNANHLTLSEDTLATATKEDLAALRDVGNTTNVVSLSVTTQYERPLRTTISYTYAKSEIGKSGYYGTYIYNSFGFSADYLLLKNKLRAEGGVNMTADGSENGKDPAGNTVTTVTKNSVTGFFAGARYTVNEHHSVYFRADLRSSSVSTDQIYMLRYEARF